MFHFPAFPPHTLYIQVQVTPHDWCRVSPFGHPRITARLTAPRGLSQPPTSFIGSWCQDIHRMPLHTCHKDARIHCAVLKHQPAIPANRDHHTTPQTGWPFGRNRNPVVILPSSNPLRVLSQDPTVCRTRRPRPATRPVPRTHPARDGCSTRTPSTRPTTTLHQ